MRIATTIARVLLGLIFLVFGLNGFLHFIPAQPMPDAVAKYLGALAATGYMLQLIFATQVVAGLLLLSGLFVPLALALLAPVIVNIILFHVFMLPAGLPPAIVVTALELFLVWAHREAFAPMLRPGMTPHEEAVAMSTRPAAAS